jgi:peptidoglycan-associated lipoprotein
MNIDNMLVAAILLFLLLLNGCATRGGPGVPPGGQQPGAGPQQGGVGEVGPDGSVSTSPLGQDSTLQLDPLQDPDSPLAVRVVYFDFDSANIPPESQEVVNAHGQYLANHPEQKVRLEGHTDERGSREYNLGLGERRAQSVSQLVKLQGVAPTQVELISYGEEMPTAFGHDEESWRLNRRVEFVYIDQQ